MTTDYLTYFWMKLYADAWDMLKNNREEEEKVKVSGGADETN